MLGSRPALLGGERGAVCCWGSPAVWCAPGSDGSRKAGDALRRIWAYRTRAMDSDRLEDQGPNALASVAKVHARVTGSL